MNTANLQLEGLLIALSSLLDVMKQKGLFTQEEIDEALSAAEAVVTGDGRRPAEISPANVDAILFPIRFLRLACERGADLRTFTDIASAVGKTKPDR